MTLVPSTNTKDSRVRTTRVTISIIILEIDFYICEYVSKLESKGNFYSSSFLSREQRQCRNVIKPALLFPLSCTLCPLDQTYLSGSICKFPLPQRQQNENTFLPIKHFRMDFDNKTICYCSEFGYTGT